MSFSWKSPRSKSGTLTSAACMMLFLFSISCSAIAQDSAPRQPVLIYRTIFSETGTSVNYPNPVFGRFFVDPQTGIMSSVTVLVDPITRLAYYSTTFLSGTLFKATPFGGGNPYDVIASSNTASGTEQIFLQITGMASRRLDIGGGDSYRLSGRLTGMLLMSGADRLVGDRPVAVDAVSAELGFVGFSEVTAILQKGATRRFNDAGLGLVDAIEAYTEELEAIGIEPLEDPNPGPSPSPSPLPIPTPTPVFNDDGGFDFEVISR